MALIAYRGWCCRYHDQFSRGKCDPLTRYPRIRGESNFDPRFERPATYEEGVSDYPQETSRTDTEQKADVAIAFVLCRLLHTDRLESIRRPWKADRFLRPDSCVPRRRPSLRVSQSSTHSAPSKSSLMSMLVSSISVCLSNTASMVPRLTAFRV